MILVELQGLIWFRATVLSEELQADEQLLQVNIMYDFPSVSYFLKSPEIDAPALSLLCVSKIH